MYPGHGEIRGGDSNSHRYPYFHKKLIDKCIYIYILYFIIASVWKDLNITSSVKHLCFSSRTQEQKAKFGSKHFRVLSESWFENLLSELAWNTVIIMFEMTPEMRM